MSDTNRVGLRAVRETTFGTTPSNPAFFEIASTGQPNLGLAPATVVSNLLRDDRQVSDLILVGGEAGGEANSELAFGLHDELLESAFFSAWQTRYAKRNDRGATQVTAVAAATDDYTVTLGVTTGSITVDFAAAGDTVTRATGSFVTDGFEAGDTVIISGAVDGGNNAQFLVKTVTALVLTLENGVVDETADTGVTISVCARVGSIIRAEGFTNAANNGYFVVAAGTTATSIVTVDGRVNETPPATAQIHLVGYQAASADIVATASGFTSTLFDFANLKLASGDWLRITGTGGTWPAANIGWGRIASVATNAVVWETAPTGWTTDPGTGVVVQFYVGDRLINGVTRSSFSLERTFSDHSPVTYQYLTGFIPDQVVITGASQAILESNFTFVGLDSEFTETRFAGSTDIDASVFQVLNTSSNVARIARGGVVLIGAGTKNLVTELSFTIANNLRRKNAIGFLGAADVGAGEFNVTGSLAAYFDDKTIAEQVVNNTETSVDARFEDSSAHVLLTDCPRIKYSEGQPEVSGKNADVTISPNFQALRHATFGYTMKLQRFFGYQ
jgi:hypothetical protein